jgi:hypothetical protein
MTDTSLNDEAEEAFTNGGDYLAALLNENAGHKVTLG